MQIFVKTLTNTVTLDVSADTQVNQLKASVENVSFIPAECQRLTFGSSTLIGSRTLGDCGIASADTVELLLDVNGGMRAKWRKKRMRRLRRKRRKMRQRAR